MCFSAGASFGASAFLAVVGIAAIKKVQEPSRILFASIPIIFSVQQFIEGLLWISFNNSNYVFFQEISAYLFLTFAHIIWPITVPLSILLLEKEVKRKKILQLFLAMGTLAALYLACCLFVFDLKVQAGNYHIHYELNYPDKFTNFIKILYFIPTVISPFFSSIRRMSFVGWAIFFSLILSRLFFGEYLISVWCYFAGLISLLVLIILGTFYKSQKIIPHF